LDKVAEKDLRKEEAMDKMRLTVLLLALCLGMMHTVPGGAATPGGWPRIDGGPEGNPLLTSASDLSRPAAVRDRFRQAPRYLVSGDLMGDGRDSLAVLFTDGSLEVHTMEDGRFRRLASWSGIAPEAPPVVFTGPNETGLLCVDTRGRLSFFGVNGGQGRNIADGLSTLTFPLAADLNGDGKGEIAMVRERGELTILLGDGGSEYSRDPPLLPDARLTVADLDGDGKLEIAVLTRPLDKVKAGHLGDDVEAQGLAVFALEGRNLRLQAEYRLEGRRFFEALSPLIADLDRSGKPSLVVPVGEEGAGSAVWSFTYASHDLRKTAEGPKTRDAREYYQLLAATPALGDQDRAMILAVVGVDGRGTLEALRPDLANTRLGTSDGIYSHVAGSRILDMALVGDLAGNGKRVLLAPAGDGESLRLFAFGGNALLSKEIFSGSKSISSNLCPGDFDGDGKLDVALGTQDGSLIVLTGR
jgi:hypothetical protein